MKTFPMRIYSFAAASSLYWETGSRTRDIETAGYALLTQVSMNRLEYAGPISLWLSEQQEFGSIAVSGRLGFLQMLLQDHPLANDPATRRYFSSGAKYIFHAKTYSHELQHTLRIQLS